MYSTHFFYKYFSEFRRDWVAGWQLPFAKFPTYIKGGREGVLYEVQ